MAQELASAYHPKNMQAWQDHTIITMPFWADSAAQWKIHGLDFGYDVAEMVCISGDYINERQSISLAKLLRLLGGEDIGTVTFRYVVRWYDDDDIPHYFGIYSKYSTIAEAKRNTVFRLIAINREPDIVYQALDEDDMYKYLGDVSRNQDNKA